MNNNPIKNNIIYIDISSNSFSSRFINLEGKIFKNFKVVAFIGKSNFGSYIWLCKCKCGNYFIESTQVLLKYKNKSCGCNNYKFNGKHHNQKYSPRTASFRAKASNFKAQAKIRNIKWDLTISETISLMKQNCYYCNSKPSQIYKLGRNRINKYKSINLKCYTIKYNGIDRLNSKKGYIKQNCVPCCDKCNFMKHILSYTQFINKIKKIYINHVKKN